MAKIPSTIDIPLEELLAALVDEVNEQLMNQVREDIIALSARLDSVEAAQTVVLDATDGLRIALQEWSQKRPPEKPNKP